MNPDWDGIMKARAREPNPSTQIVFQSPPFPKPEQLRLLEDALRKAVSEEMAAMLNVPAVVSRLYDLGLRAWGKVVQ